MFDKNLTYCTDFPLFKKLGWKLFNIKGNQKHFVGETIINNKIIKCYVECWPAMFWFFKIYDNDINFDWKKDDVIKIDTGSGTLTEYWPKILRLVNNQEVQYDNMFVRK